MIADTTPAVPPANRLARERSPYLLQHAHNPVDWHPWGEEAFAKAREEDKPVFLSVGYSTCHWCHVMAHESFESADVAAVMWGTSSSRCRAISVRTASALAAGRKPP